MTDKNVLEKYARLTVETGVNIQPGQTLVVNTPIECAAFARAIATAAYQRGARDVVMNWKDELFAKIRFLHAPTEVFGEFPDWQREFYLSYARQGAAFVTIAASDPELLRAVDPARVALAEKTGSTALAAYREMLMSNRNTWSIVSVPTTAWAQKVFPGEAADAAARKLWQAIIKTVRVDRDDPVAAWEKHKQVLQRRREFLNKHQFKSLHYRNALGTDLTIALPDGHIWLGGSEFTPAGVEFVANMPTEEVFTLPQRTGVNGTVVSSKPLNYNGNLIENFSFTFRDGKVVDFRADKGAAVLEKLLQTDDGASHLGEVSLVPYDSPISQANILFYNTLFDENASCHLALGKAYPVCLQGGADMSEEELAAAGANDSLIHVDFMVGTKDLEITGTTVAGQEVAVFRRGNFAGA